jgi:GntR family transcriptional regulator
MKSKTPVAAALRAGRTASTVQLEPLDKSSYVPMYAQIQTQLQTMIHNGRLKAGDTLPSEEELSRVFGVSRMTARQALQALRNLGLAARHKGLGTFVTQPKVEKDITHLLGFTAEMTALGMKPSSQLLQAEVRQADEKTAQGLSIQRGAPVFVLRRLRYADGLPMAIEESTLSLARFPGIDTIDFQNASLYETLRQRYNVRLSLVDEVLEAHLSERNEAQMLEMPVHSCLLVILRVLWNMENEPVELARSLYRGDRYSAVLRIPAHTNK